MNTKALVFITLAEGLRPIYEKGRKRTLCGDVLLQEIRLPGSFPRPLYAKSSETSLKNQIWVAASRSSGWAGIKVQSEKAV